MISGCECDHWAKRARQQDVARPQRFAELRQHPGNPMHRIVGVAEARSARTHRCDGRSEEHTSELQSLMRISYAVFCLKKKTYNNTSNTHQDKLLPTTTT